MYSLKRQLQRAKLGHLGLEAHLVEFGMLLVNDF